MRVGESKVYFDDNELWAHPCVPTVLDVAETTHQSEFLYDAADVVLGEQVHAETDEIKRLKVDPTSNIRSIMPKLLAKRVRVITGIAAELHHLGQPSPAFDPALACEELAAVLESAGDPVQEERHLRLVH